MHLEEGSWTKASEVQRSPCDSGSHKLARYGVHEVVGLGASARNDFNVRASWGQISALVKEACGLDNSTKV